MPAVSSTSVPHDQSLARKVRLARAVAAEMLIGGIDPTANSERTLAEHVVAVLAVDHPVDAEGLRAAIDSVDEDEYVVLCRRIEAAFALGIAVGHLTRHELFAVAGGAR